jgi:rRNA maturation protein Nop10
MRPVLRHAVLAAGCVCALVLVGCGKHVASNAPITFAPADTPYVYANLDRVPVDVLDAWTRDLSGQTSGLGQLAERISRKAPTAARILDALQAELATIHSRKDLVQATGFPQSPSFAIYGIGDVPVARVELDSPDTFKAFWARVEKRAGVTAPTATLDKQTYWVLGGADDKVHFLVAIEDRQLVITVAPANASPTLLKQLLGLTKPTRNAADRLAGINSRYGYLDSGFSGYVDVPRLFANLFDGKNAITQEFTRDLGGSLANPTCASEFASLADQVPLISGGMHTYTTKEASGRIDVQLSPSLLGALTALKQPVPGMDETSNDSMFDMVMALPVQKWQAFIQDRARAAAEKAYQCPALRSLNKFARSAANPPVRLPPEAASVLGFRVVLDRWDAGPQIAGRALVASSNPAALAQKIQQTLPQFALKTIPTDGKPVAFALPPRFSAMLGGGKQGWIAADANALAIGAGDGEDAKLAGTLGAPAGDGDRLLRMHFDGKMYGVLGSWMGRFAVMAPTANQAQVQQQVAAFQQMGKIIGSVEADVRLDDKGLHFEADITHR